MPADMELQVVASLLRRGRSLDQLSTGLTLLGVLFGLAQLLLASISTICLLLALWMIILGLLQKYWALRVAFAGRVPGCGNAFSPCSRAISSAPPTSTKPCKPWVYNRPNVPAALGQSAVAAPSNCCVNKPGCSARKRC